MSNIYPTLEDLKVDGMIQAQARMAQEQEAQRQIAHGPGGTIAYPQPYPQAASGSTIYPSLGDYMGLAVPAEYHGGQVAVPNANSASSQMIAPITGQANKGLMRSEIKGGVRQLVLCKDGSGKIGLRVQAVNKGVFVAFVNRDSPASMVGLRFGDQILEINDQVVAGWSTDQTLKFLKKCPCDNIRMVIRDRPFERVITMQKDSAGYVGFVYKDGKITSIVKDSSAARNGLLIDHQLIEVHGQNVVGLKDKEVQKIIESAGRTITITIMPCFVFDHIMKQIGWSLVKKSMDHSIPEC